MQLPAWLSIERVVAILGPFFAAGASWVTALLAANVPGLPTPPTNIVEAVMIAAFLGACAIVIKWLHGRQIPEIAKLVPSEKEMEGAYQQVMKVLTAQGAAGPSADQVRSLIREELRAVLAVGAQTQAPVTPPQ